MIEVSNLDRIADTLVNFEFPKKFAVEVCADCNLRCSMCHHPQMRRPKGVMPLALWMKCADEIAGRAPQTECWFSFCGEPLLEPNLLVRMVAYGKSVGLESINLNTNGQLMTREVAEKIIDSGVDLVVFGIDGFTRRAYEQIRVGGDRDLVYSNATGFLELCEDRGYGPQVQVQFIVMPENEKELETFKWYWLEHGATVKVRNPLSWGGKFDTDLEVPFERRIPCPWAITMMHVFWDGRVPRCPGDTEGEEGVGNAWHEPLATLWKRLGQYRRLHLEHRFEELPERCQSCKDWMTGAAERIAPEFRGVATRGATVKE